MDTTQVFTWLESLGYSLSFRHDGWTECLLSCGDERWFGAGPNTESASRDALLKAFPSEASRMSLGVVLKALGQTDEPGPIAEPIAHATPEELLPPPQEEPGASVPEGQVEIALPAGVSAQEALDGLVALEDLAVLLPFAQEALVVQSPRDSDVPNNPVGERREMVLPEEAIGAIKVLEHSLVAMEAHIGLLSPERQKLVLQALICEARSYEELHVVDERVTKAVHRLVQAMSKLTKLYWPGSIESMKDGSGPAVVCLDHDLAGSEPKTWYEAFLLVVHALEAKIDEGERRGFDEYGWADEGSLKPVALKPEVRLKDLANRLENLTGPLDQPPEFDKRRFPPKPTLVQMDDFKKLAQIARWLRLAAPEYDILWGRVVGRLRALCSRIQKGPRAAIEQVLEPSFVPPSGGWAGVLGEQPGKRQRQAGRRQVYVRLKEPTGVTGADIKGLLPVAFEVFNSNELEGLLANQYEHIKGLDGGEVFERRTHRTRFKKLQETLKGLSEIDALQAFGELGVKLDKEAPEGGVEDDSTLLAKTPDEALEEEVRKRTDSRRALLITNRPDTDLANALETRLGFSKVEVKLSNPRQVASTTESIANGHWDFVLMASGFLSHSVDGVIFDACRRAGVRAIRVNKGRPGIVVRTLGRVLVYGQDG